MTMRALVFVTVAAAAAIAGCEPEPGGPAAPAGQAGGAGAAGAEPESELGAAARDAAEKLDTLVEDGKDKAVAAAREGLEAARARFEDLKARGSRIEEEKRPEFERTVSDLEAQLEDVDERLERLGEAGADAWGKLADEVGAGLRELGESLSAAASRFGEP